MKHKILLLISSLFLIGCSQFKPTAIEGGKDIDPFDFQGNSLVSELSIDGIRDEAQWNQGEYTTQEYIFTYKNKLNNELYDYSFIVYRGTNELFVFYKVYDCNICTYGNDNGSSVSFSDSCELYLDTKLDGGSKPQSDDYQIDLGVHGKTRVLCGNGNGWSTWNGIVQYETYIDGTLNSGDNDIDNYYCVEMSIPYKQIGITRDQDIGITFGIVDRYIESGSSSNKQWYGATINGHFGGPQNPDSYFILKKNSLEIAPVPEYIPESDQTVYADNYTMKIESATRSGDEYPEISYKIGRKDKVVSVLATTANKWPEHVGICFLFDFDDPNRGSRDGNTLIARAYPGSRSLLDFYKYPNIGLDKAILDIRVNDNSCFISFDFDQFMINEYKNINFCASSITADSTRTTVKVLSISGVTLNQGELKTYGRLTPENRIEIDTIDAEYQQESDTTSYASGVAMTIPEKTVSDVSTSAKTVKIARSGNKVTILVKNTNRWSSVEQIMLLLDLGSATRTIRDVSTSIVRFYPANGSVHDFFLYPNTVLDKNIPVFEFFNNATKVTIDISKYTENIPDYTENGVGIAAALCDADSRVICYCSYNDVELGTNPSIWPRLSSTNSIM